ncbi:FABP family protein [Granulicoccus sp. GXG6511]|uniref:FABP family protein n=1 Tax=Granulicoccus sp. GXG6511 TaxID=3381351 RepID=UPI003D7CD23E
MHDAVAHLAPLLGTWRGEGHGTYPTIESFDYVDEWEFSENGKPFLRFVERTWIGGEPRHTEVGYIRCPAPGVVEIVAAIPTGQAECGTGSVDVSDGLVVATDATVGNTESAKQVDRIVRRFEVDGDTLTYGMEMAAVGEPLTLHLKATLQRVS